MTDRVCGFIVVLKEDLRVDDVEVLRKAISLLSDVEDVRSLPSEIMNSQSVYVLRGYRAAIDGVVAAMSEELKLGASK